MSDEAAATPPENSVTICRDGPLEVGGRLVVRAKDGSVISEEPVAWLCRCGHSKTKPFCDGSHTKQGFRDDASLGPGGAGEAGSIASDEPLTLTVMPAGPVIFSGPVEVRGVDGARRCRKGALCRCGASATKPFCDGAHAGVGFTGE